MATLKSIEVKTGYKLLPCGNSDILCLMSLVMLVFSIYACSSKKEQDSINSTSGEIMVPDKDSWIPLFNGTSAAGWRGYNQKTLPKGWVVEDGTLKSLGQGGDIGGDIVYGAMEFEDFELYMEWKISEGGNSGIFYHILESDKYKVPYETAPEYQLLDDIGFPEKVEDWQQVGADYAMYPADTAKKKVKKAGEWNSSRIIFQKMNVEYWLNGEKVVQFVPWSKDWYSRKNSGKWINMPDYGMAKKGLIGLQDHGSFIWFRNIKIRKL
ncbi:DUF1080 domain-containing protein [Reichenbachiella sp. MALMAid0571]|uniref:3-keto-disaccharide hydrolase n=1 Tax=Reichenbachiella sp. MALMAid0571 TaxID=3143939 RepID=UPI0032E02FE1